MSDWSDVRDSASLAYQGGFAERERKRLEQAQLAAEMTTAPTIGVKPLKVRRESEGVYSVYLLDGRDRRLVRSYATLTGAKRGALKALDRANENGAGCHSAGVYAPVKVSRRRTAEHLVWSIDAARVATGNRNGLFRVVSPGVRHPLEQRHMLRS